METDQSKVKVGAGSGVRSVIKYSNLLLKERNLRTVHFSAIGGAIGKLVNVVEVLKIVNSGLYQISKLGTVVYQTVDSQGGVSGQRLFPKLEVTLTMDAPSDKNEGFQEKLIEEERLNLLTILNNTQRRPEYAPRGRDFGIQRGGRGFNSGRGMQRGNRFPTRGGRGMTRGAPRGSPRGQRGFQRGGFRNHYQEY